MTSKTRRLAFTAGFVVLFALTIWSWIPGKAEPRSEAPASVALDHSDDLEPLEIISPAPERDGDVALEGHLEYAIGLHDLAGLSRTVTPGTVVDLWVAWDPPIMKDPQYQRLIRSVIVKEIEPPFVPEGPFTVVLSVPKDKISDLLYADRYGAISVAMLGGN